MKSQNGIILVTSVIVLCVVSILTMGFLSLINSNTFITTSNLNSTKAFYIAEAGIADAIQYEEDISASKIFADGQYEFKVTLNEDGSRSIISTGKIKDSQRTIKLKITSEGKITGWQEV